MLKFRRRAAISTLFAFILVFATCMPAMGSLSPAVVEATLNPGESIAVEKIVSIPAVAPKIDVVFAFDLTGSMGGVLDLAKTEALEVMTQLRAASGSDVQFGVVSYMDYPHDYADYYGYTSTYGVPGVDYAYGLGQGVTADDAAVQTVIGGLVLGNGADGPESYTRVMYESYSDPGIGWRPGARRIVVNFGDNVTHDNDLSEGLPAGLEWLGGSTGGDPGRDEIAMTADDLDWQTVLAEMATNNVTLLHVDSYGSYLDLWNHWAGITGGQAYQLSSDTFVADLVAKILETATSPTVAGLALVPEAGWESWFSVSPASYSGDIGDIPFTETIVVPAGTAPGAYEFFVTAADSAGVSYGTQTVRVTVPGGEVCYKDETAWAAGSRYVTKGNWAMYVPYAGEAKTVDVFASQSMLAGTATFSAPHDGMVDITIQLTDGFVFWGDGHNVKVQDYAAKPPAKNPAPGTFAWKAMAAQMSTTYVISVPANSFYGIHLDVAYPIPCDY